LIRGLEVQESGLDQDPYQKKNTFTSLTRVPVVQIEQMRAHLKGLSARIVMSSKSMVTCAHISNKGHDGTQSFRNFIMMVKKFKDHNFEPILAYGHDPAQVPDFQNWA
jgi:hypothetical protein